MAATNIIDSVQQLYTGLTTFTGKPAELWFGDVWPTRADGTAVSPPYIRFTHQGTDTDHDFEYTALEDWPFRFEIYGKSPQEVLTIFDRVRFNGANPEAQSGFWYAATMVVPAGYVFKSLVPKGKFSLEVRSGQWSPTGTPIHVLSFDMVLSVHRVTFA